MLYFAYGSNLNICDMKRRCPDSVPASKVKLKNYTLVFNTYADIVENSGDILEGAIYEVSDMDIRKLDEYEEFPELYEKINVEVEDERSKKYKALVYIMVNKGSAEPEKKYFQSIAEGYKDWGLKLEPLETARNKSRQ
ncbi:MAG: gamma-glutamylcyclotransferase family protein [Clostridiaceae bacterium]